jgi:hypothetical protein
VSSHNESEFQYEAYGLLFRSNSFITGLMPATSSIRRPDIRINLGSVPDRDAPDCEDKLRYTSSYLDAAGEPALVIWNLNDGAFLRMSYSDGTEFWLDRQLETMWVHWAEGSSLENALSYLLGPVLGLVLRLRGVVCLHASAVAINGHSIVFVGAEGAGKSTTAAAFAKKGFAVLSDDIVALVEQGCIFHVLPAYPRVNLWPNSVGLLYGSPDALPRIMPDWDKRCLTLGQDSETRFEERTLPIGAIYVLGDPSSRAVNGVERISQKTAMITLVTNTYATNFLDARQRAEEFEVLSRLVAAVPVRKINPRRNMMPVEALCDFIMGDFANI